MTGFHTVLAGDLPALVINKPIGNLTLSAGGTGILRTTHNWTFTAVAGTFSATGNTVVFAGGTISGSHTLNNVDIRGTVTLAAGTTLTTTGTLNLFSGTLNQAAATGTLAAQGNVDVQSGFTGGGTATLLLNGTGAQTMTGYQTVASGALPVVSINKPSGAMTIAGTLRTGANWTYTAAPGGLLVAGSTVTFVGGTISGSHTLEAVQIRGGTVTIAAGTTLTTTGTLNLFSGTLNQAAATGTLAAQGNVDVQSGFTGGGTATLLLNGTGAQTMTGYQTVASGALPVVSINKPSGAMTIAGTLRTGANWTYTAAPGGLLVAGSTVTFVGGTISGSHTLEAVQIRGGTVTIAAGTTLTTTGTLNLFSGTLNQAAATGTLAAQGNVDVQSGFTGGGTATLLLNGTGAQTMTGYQTVASGALPVVSINKPSGAMTIAGTLRTGANWTYTAAPGGLLVAGSTVTFVGGTISGSHTLEAVQIRGGTVTIAAGTTLTTTGTLNLFSGTLNQAAATGTLAAQGNVDVQSGFTGGGTATLLLNGTGAQTMTGYQTVASGALPVVSINKPSGAMTIAGTLRTGANWTYTAAPGGLLVAGSTVTFVGGTISGSHTLEAVQIRGGTVTIAAGTTLTTTGTLNLFSGTLNQAAATGTLAAQGNVDVQSGFTGGGTATLLLNGTGAQTMTGSATTIAGDLPNVQIASSGTVNLVGTVRLSTGTWTYLSGTLDPGTSLVVFDGTVTISGSHTLHDVYFIGSGSKTIAAGTTLTVPGLLTLDNGSIDVGTISATGDVTQLSGFDGGSGTLRIEGSGTQTMTGSATTIAGDLPNVQIASSGTVNLVGTVRLSTGTWTYLSGTLDPGTSLVVFDGTVTISGSHTLHDVYFIGSGSKTIAAGTTLTVPGLLTLDNGSIDVGTISATGDVTQLSGFDGGSGTLRIEGSGTQTMTGSATTIAGDLPNVQIASSGTVNLVGTVRLSTGTWTYLSGTLDPGTSLVVFDGTVTISGSHTLHDVYFIGSGSKTIAAGTTLTVPGLLTLDNGSIDVGTISATGDVTQLSGFDGGSGTLRIEGSGTQTMTGSATTIAGDLPNVQIASSGTVNLVGTVRLSTGTWTYLSGTLDPGTSLVVFDGTVTISGSHTLHDVELRGGGSKTVTLGDTLTVAGLLTLTDGDLDGGTIDALGDINLLGTFDGETGTIRIAGTSDQTLTGAATPTTGDVANIVIDKSGGTLHLGGTIHLLTASWTWLAGAVDPGTSLLVLDSGTTISGTHTLYDMLITGGAHTVGSGTPTAGGTLTLENGTIDGGTLGAAGDVNQLVTFDGGTGALEINGAGSQTFTGSATLAAGSIPDLRIDSGGLLTLIGTIRTTNDWTYVSGGVNPGSSLVVLAGTLTVDSGAMSFNDVTVNGGTTSLASDFDVNGDLDVAAGGMNAGVVTMYVGGDVTVDGTFIAGMSDLTLDGGSPQVIGGAAAGIGLYDLTVTSGAGTTATNALAVAGTLTLFGPLDFSGQTLGIGNAIAGTPTDLTGNAASSLFISGSGAGIVIPSSLPALANLTLDNPNGAALSADLTVGTLLTLTDGVLDSGSAVTIVSPAAAVNRTSGHVAGALRKTIPTSIGLGMMLFEIGDQAVYAPVSLTFGSVTTSGTVTASTTAGEHPALGASVIDPSADVNRWWRIVNAGTAFTTVDAVFTWDPSDVDAGADPMTFVVAKWDGSWALPPSGGATATSIVAFGMTSFSEFAVGGVSDEGDGLPDTAQPNDPGRWLAIVLIELAGAFLLLAAIAASVRRGGRPTA